MTKVDFIIRKDEPYREVEFEWRRPVSLGDAMIFTVAPEDLILSKLIWSLDSQSNQQFDDVRMAADDRGP